MEKINTEKWKPYSEYNEHEPNEGPILEEDTVSFLKEWFNDCMEHNDTHHYVETIPLRQDGHLSTEERIGDSAPPFLTNVFNQVRGASKDEGGVESRSLSTEQFYKLIQELQKKLPEFEFKIEVDPKERRWIKYSVIKK